MSGHEMDELDRAIIRELEQDGRRSMREIARNLQSSEATVRSRMKRLRDLNLLRIVAFADPGHLSGRQLAIVSLTVDPVRHDAIVEALVEMPETTYVSTVLGNPDIVFEVQCRDNRALWQLLNERVAVIPGVRTLSTQPVLVVHKLAYRTVD